jgi:pimeloyl-ACP methyl ester carboxylesterase
MTTTTLGLQASGARAIASLREGDDSSLPLIIALHGGGFNRHYFDLESSSFLDRAAANGFAALTIDRPGYGESTGVDVEEGWFPAQTEALDGLIADAWRQVGAARPGIVLIGHSFGATIAIRLAGRSRERSWPLLALAISGSLDGPPPSMLGFAASIGDAPPHAPIALEPPMVREFFYGPDDSFDPAVLDEATTSVAPAPAVEIREWAHRWSDEAAAATAAVEVPVHLRVSENDAVLDVTPDSLTRFASSFSAAPSMDAALIEGAGHNADHHHAGTTLHLEQLAFASSVLPAAR